MYESMRHFYIQIERYSSIWNLLLNDDTKDCCRIVTTIFHLVLQVCCRIVGSHSNTIDIHIFICAMPELQDCSRIVADFLQDCFKSLNYNRYVKCAHCSYCYFHIYYAWVTWLLRDCCKIKNVAGFLEVTQIQWISEMSACCFEEFTENTVKRAFLQQ